VRDEWQLLVPKPPATDEKQLLPASSGHYLPTTWSPCLRGRFGLPMSAMSRDYGDAGDLF